MNDPDICFVILVKLFNRCWPHCVFYSQTCAWDLNSSSMLLTAAAAAAHVCCFSPFQKLFSPPFHSFIYSFTRSRSLSENLACCGETLFMSSFWSELSGGKLAVVCWEAMHNASVNNFNEWDEVRPPRGVIMRAAKKSLFPLSRRVQAMNVWNSCE
jgi:hypothetical protein